MEYNHSLGYSNLLQANVNTSFQPLHTIDTLYIYNIVI